MNFLSEGPGATAQGLGGAFTAIADDATAIYHNPAGLTFQRGAFAAEYMGIFGGGRYNYLAVTYPSKIGTLGLGAIQFATGDIEKRRFIGDTPTTINASQTAYYLPYSYFWKNTSYGLSLKKIDYNLGGASASGYGADAGVIHTKYLNDFRHIATPSLNVGLVVKNLLQPSMKLSKTKEVFPREFQGGVAASGCMFGRYNTNINELVYDKITVSVDALLREDGRTEYLAGFEYAFRSLFSFRAGFKNNPSFGLGYGGEKTDYRFDYSLDMANLMPQHKLTFSYYFTDARPHPSLSPKLRKYKSVQQDRVRYRDRYLVRGKKYLDNRQYELAEAEFDNARVLDPFNDEINTLAARSHEGSIIHQVKQLLDASRTAIDDGDYRAAAKYAFDAVRVDPANQEVIEFIPFLWNKVATQGHGEITIYNELRDDYLTKISADVNEAIKKRDIPRARGILKQAKTLDPDGEARWGDFENALQNAEKTQYEEYERGADVARAASCWYRAYRDMLYEKDIQPDNKALAQEIRSFEQGYAARMRFTPFDKLYHEQIYYLAAIDYVKGDLALCVDKIEGLLKGNATHPQANFLRRFLIEKYYVDKNEKF